MQANPALKLREQFGTDAEIAQQFNKLTRQAVNLWMTQGIPPERALETEEVTKGDITAMEVLRFYRTRRTKKTNGQRRAA